MKDTYKCFIFVVLSFPYPSLLISYFTICICLHLMVQCPRASSMLPSVWGRESPAAMSLRLTETNLLHTEVNWKLYCIHFLYCPAQLSWLDFTALSTFALWYWYTKFALLIWTKNTCPDHHTVHEPPSYSTKAPAVQEDFLKPCFMCKI